MSKVISIDEARRPRPEVGQLFVGRYSLMQRLGRGGMGAVWTAYDERVGRMVAVKLLHPKLLREPGYRERFDRETQALTQLEHPNVVRLYDAGTEPQPFIVTARILGITLRERLRACGQVPWVEAVCFAIQIAEGLWAIHRMKMWHRDVKPENIMVDEDGNVTILDLGIARHAAPSKVGEATDRVGTLGYLPPEMILGRPTDHRGDLYQLGTVLYELITGRKPYSGINEASETDVQMAHVHFAPDPILVQVPECPEELEAIVFRLLAKDPAKRYSNARELSADLGRVLRLRGSLPAGHALEPMVQRAMVRRKLNSLAQDPEVPADEGAGVDLVDPLGETTEPMREPPQMTLDLEPGFAAQSPASPNAHLPCADARVSGERPHETLELGPAFVPQSPASPAALAAADDAAPAYQIPTNPRTCGFYPAVAVPTRTAELPRTEVHAVRAPFPLPKPIVQREPAVPKAGTALVVILAVVAVGVTLWASGVRLTLKHDPAPATAPTQEAAPATSTRQQPPTGSF